MTNIFPTPRVAVSWSHFIHSHCRIKCAHRNNPVSLHNSIPFSHFLPLLSSYLRWNIHRFLRFSWARFTSFSSFLPLFIICTSTNAESPCAGVFYACNMKFSEKNFDLPISKYFLHLKNTSLKSNQWHGANLCVLYVLAYHFCNSAALHSIKLLIVVSICTTF